jgi:pimeloyl-ACP methyl ester carboxylesterase
MAQSATIEFVRPQTLYARSGDVHVAYQVVGEGPFDLGFVPGFVSNLEYGWEEPTLESFYRRLASFCRPIIFDKRGTGLSDRVGGVPDLEPRMDDVRAIMDTLGSRRAAVLGYSDGRRWPRSSRPPIRSGRLRSFSTSPTSAGSGSRPNGAARPSAA